MSIPAEREEHERLLYYLQYTLHELPAGVLYGANAATESECAELMRATYRLEELSGQLGTDVTAFIATCRWHYERYPHYLGRHRHFSTYANYITKHKGPGTVTAALPHSSDPSV